MELSGIGSLSTALSQAQTGDAAAILVMKKALEIQQQGALQLIQSLPQPTGNPPHLGQNIDVKA